MILAREREAKAIELRKAGATFEQIGERLKITTAAAHLCVKRALSKLINAESVEEVRALELARCDSLHLSRWKKALGEEEGAGAAFDRVLKVMERRAKLTGVDAPAKQEVSGPNGGPLLLAAVDIDDCDDANFKERMAEAGAFFAALRLPPKP